MISKVVCGLAENRWLSEDYQVNRTTNLFGLIDNTGVCKRVLVRDHSFWGGSRKYPAGHVKSRWVRVR
jgi:hypothetical protein